MAEHKFGVGQTITYSGPFGGRSAASGTYQVVAQLPEQNGELTYRIKSRIESHERIARESELKRAG